MKLFLSIAAVFVLVFFSSGLVTAETTDIKIGNDKKLGHYLTDGQGKTLYWFKKDSPGKSACAGPCIEKWPVFNKEKIAPAKGLKKEDFGTIKRDDGAKQTTFKGYPLYYWVNDKKPGDTSGQGVNDVWFVVNPHDFPPK